MAAATPRVRLGSRLELCLGLGLGACLAACAAPTRAHARPRPPAQYRVEIPAPHTQYVEVEVDLGPPKGRYTDVAMPAWTPGSYLIRDYAKHVYAMRARTRGGQPVRVEHRDKQTWRVHHGGRRFALHYRVFAAERTVRTSHVDDQHASLHGASLFVYVPGETDRRCEVEVEVGPEWAAHSSLPIAREGDLARFTAPTYDVLVDSPVELGKPAVKAFDVDGTTFEFVLTGGADVGADLDRLAGDAKKIVTAFGKLMGGFPMRRYVFFLHVTEDGGGGLEHADSTMMMISRSAFDSDKGYDRAARLIAHEFFHLWNVKRIHDVALGPFDYARENHSDLLWFHEGFTETAEGIALLRAGLWSPAEYLRAYGRRYTDFRKRPGRNFAPLAQMSHQAWTKGYKPEPNHRNVAVSYYDKGDLVGLALDLEIRRRAPSGSLMGVFRRLMASHGDKGRGIQHADIVAAASAEAGEDMGWFFDRYVRGTDELELSDTLGDFAVKVGRKHDGGAWIGAELRGTTIRNIVPGSPADEVALMRGDELVSVGRRRVTHRADVQQQLELFGPGTTATLHFFRGARLLEATVAVQKNPYSTYRFTLEKTGNERRKRWLGK